jgi:hypothetical protein
MPCFSCSVEDAVAPHVHGNLLDWLYAPISIAGLHGGIKPTLRPQDNFIFHTLHHRILGKLSGDIDFSIFSLLKQWSCFATSG